MPAMGTGSSASSLYNLYNMNNPKLNPLELPEIISPVGDFLERNDLLNCIRVSKSFHSTLIGRIWKNILVAEYHYETKRKYPIGETLQKHKKYIEAIIFRSDDQPDESIRIIIPDEYWSLQGCDRLQFIAFEGWMRYKQNEHLSLLLKNHSSTITRLYFNNTQTSRELWETMLGCTNLERLEVTYTNIDDEIDVFLQVCKKIKYLYLNGLSLNRLPASFLGNENSDYNLSNMHTLSLCDIRVYSQHSYTKAYSLGALVRRCPGLRVLEFLDFFEGDGDSFYKEAFLQHPWTQDNLSELILLDAQLKDENTARFLRRMSGLKWLDIPRCELGQHSLQELLSDKQEAFDNGQMVWKTRPQKLCETVERLVFNVRGTDVDGIAQAILSNCPRLKEFVGPKITMTEIANGAEWVSTGLTELAVYLEADIDQETTEGMEKARSVFKQLGKLTQLRSLKLTKRNSNDSETRTLDLRLGTGLDELANLKRLRELSFNDDDHQEIDLEEATWIMDNWPRIEYWNGKLMCDLLAPHNINTCIFLRQSIE
ncbi:hypothetical protein BCR41DRAFT_344184 [Lobosporangium transversale]|uniref:F-box domain-containing protein n=1 Tax=Lobosporangium transversale TaxID=64571 RepID=A0A1Y2H731_9FUNG|nr:hypothetical protein BCR41DRAFT_344184 [Lobosporangium transversale]ORZ28852.1 hypothetical protein BCR41DRAFT_344184 [Lobosporangium transversale]|eukprot:XP_021886525.1 hypothetical protein BCR41DRAFT_344184 [Lobosporangium transversale]